MTWLLVVTAFLLGAATLFVILWVWDDTDARRRQRELTSQRYLAEARLHQMNQAAMRQMFAEAHRQQRPE